MLYCECPCACCDTQVFLLPDGSTGDGLRCSSCGRHLRAAFLQPFGEIEWLTQDSPRFLSAFEQLGAASERKRRLFACHCCRLVWDRLPDERSRAAVKVAERYAEGEADEPEFVAANAGARAAKTHSRLPWLAIEASAANPLPADVVRCFLRGHKVLPGKQRDRARRVVALLRCLFGNPFRPATLAPDLLRWRDGLLVSVARRMYDNRDFSEMPVLADMLQDAGCDDEQVLAHCRQGGEHARGCFAIDLLLGRE
jgi:hypothetical protein